VGRRLGESPNNDPISRKAAGGERAMCSEAVGREPKEAGLFLAVRKLVPGQKTGENVRWNRARMRGNMGDLGKGQSKKGRPSSGIL